MAVGPDELVLEQRDLAGSIQAVEWVEPSLVLEGFVAIDLVGTHLRERQVAACQMDY